MCKPAHKSRIHRTASQLLQEQNTMHRRKIIRHKKKLTLIVRHFHKDYRRNLLHNKNHLHHRHREVEVVEVIRSFDIMMDDSFILVESSSACRALLGEVASLLVVQFVVERSAFVGLLVFFAGKPSSNALLLIRTPSSVEGSSPFV